MKNNNQTDSAPDSQPAADPSPAESAQLTPAVHRGLPWVVATAMFMQTLDSTILNTALPSMAVSMNHSPLAMQSAVVSYALTVALLIPLSGWLADRLGTRRVFVTAVGLFALGSLCCALSPNLHLLVASRVLQGVGGAMMMPVARLALIKAFPRNELLAAMNFVLMPGLIGPVVGPLLGGWLVDVASWHWIFLINLPIALFGIWYGRRIMPNFTARIGRLDWVGFLLFGGGLVALSLSLELASDAQTTLLTTLLIVLLGLMLLVGYVRHATQFVHPLIGLNLLKIRTLRVGIAGNLAARLGTGGLPLMLPLMLQVAFHHSATVAGWMLVPMAVAAICAKPLVVPLVKRFGYRRILVSNTLMLALLTASFALPGPQTPLWWLLPQLALYGAINSIQLSSMNTISLADLGPHDVSSGNGMLAVAQQLSISFGMSVSAMLLRESKGAEWLTGGNLELAFKATFVLLGILTSLSALLFLLLKPDDGSALTERKGPAHVMQSGE